MLKAVTTFSLFVWLGVLPLTGEEVHEAPAPLWVWSNGNPGEQERVFFRREFQLPPEVVSATIVIACDDWYRLSVNGQEIGSVHEWNKATEFDVLAKLHGDKRNIINVEARNDRGPAALALHFKATLKSGKVLHLVSDAQWSCHAEAPEGWMTTEFDGSSWARAVVVAKMGDAPWGHLMRREKFAVVEIPEGMSDSPSEGP